MNSVEVSDHATSISNKKHIKAESALFSLFRRIFSMLAEKSEVMDSNVSSNHRSISPTVKQDCKGVSIKKRYWVPQAQLLT